MWLQPHKEKYLCFNRYFSVIVNFIKTVIPLGIVGVTAGISKLDAYDPNHMWVAEIYSADIRSWCLLEKVKSLHNTRGFALLSVDTTEALCWQCIYLSYLPALNKSLHVHSLFRPAVWIPRSIAKSPFQASSPVTLLILLHCPSGCISIQELNFS